MKAINKEIARRERNIPANIARMQARRDYLKNEDVTERSKMRPLEDFSSGFPEIGELENQIKSLSQERKTKIESLTSAQQLNVDEMEILEVNSRASQKTLSQELADQEREVASLKSKAVEANKKIE